MALSRKTICGIILSELQRHMLRYSFGLQDGRAYLDQELLVARIRSYYRIVLGPGDLAGSLALLKSASYVDHQRLTLGPPRRRSYVRFWRISVRGLRLLDKTIQDHRIRILW